MCKKETGDHEAKYQDDVLCDKVTVLNNFSTHHAFDSEMR